MFIVCINFVRLFKVTKNCSVHASPPPWNSPCQTQALGLPLSKLPAPCILPALPL